MHDRLDTSEDQDPLINNETKMNEWLMTLLRHFQSKRYLNILNSMFHLKLDLKSIGNITLFIVAFGRAKSSYEYQTSFQFSLCCGEGKVVLPPLDPLESS